MCVCVCVSMSYLVELEVLLLDKAIKKASHLHIDGLYGVIVAERVFDLHRLLWQHENIPWKRGRNRGWAK